MSSNKNVEISRNALQHTVIPSLRNTLKRDGSKGAARSRALLEERRCPGLDAGLEANPYEDIMTKSSREFCSKSFSKYMTKSFSKYMTKSSSRYRIKSRRIYQSICDIRSRSTGAELVAGLLSNPEEYSETNP